MYSVSNGRVSKGFSSAQTSQKNNGLGIKLIENFNYTLLRFGRTQVRPRKRKLQLFEKLKPILRVQNPILRPTLYPSLHLQLQAQRHLKLHLLTIKGHSTYELLALTGCLEELNCFKHRLYLIQICSLPLNFGR